MSQIVRLRAGPVIFGMLVVLIAVQARIVWSDIAFPTKTKVYFYDKSGKPITDPLAFSVFCYGYAARPGSPDFLKPRKKPGTYSPVKVYSFTKSCPKFGCEIDETYYTNYMYIDYCDLEGVRASKAFSVKKYGNQPIDMSKCNHLPSGIVECTATFKVAD